MKSILIFAASVALMPKYALIAYYMGQTTTTLCYIAALYAGLQYAKVTDEVKSMSRIRDEASELKGCFEVEMAQGLNKT